mmetsp:Transcript_35668/g.114793  ORF Transcript_35668/g.114793 Transcript_35668/m.114793 type:complete len:233 (+) Transcript_35668:775-1473(+)
MAADARGIPSGVGGASCVPPGLHHRAGRARGHGDGDALLRPCWLAAQAVECRRLVLDRCLWTFGGVGGGGDWRRCARRPREASPPCIHLRRAAGDSGQAVGAHWVSRGDWDWRVAGWHRRRRAAYAAPERSGGARRCGMPRFRTRALASSPRRPSVGKRRAALLLAPAQLVFPVQPAARRHDGLPGRHPNTLDGLGRIWPHYGLRHRRGRRPVRRGDTAQGLDRSVPGHGSR